MLWYFPHLAESPFKPKIVCPANVRVSGGWRPLVDDRERIPLVVNKEKQIPFDASEAGPGELTADIHGPSFKVPNAVDSRGGGKHILIFTPKEEGMGPEDEKTVTVLHDWLSIIWCSYVFISSSLPVVLFV